MSEAWASGRMQVVGVDFSSAPRARKPITLALGLLEENPLADDGHAILRIEEHRRLFTLDAFDEWLHRPAAWVAGFDFPFGLPRRFLVAQEWGVKADPGASQPGWAEITRRVAALSRLELVARCRAWTQPRAVGDKFAHRTTDGPSGASPSMKWVNPPVVLMLHAGAPRLLAAGVSIPGLCSGDASRIALEAYPGMLARQVTGRVSYKTEDRRKDDEQRRSAREAITEAIETGRMGVRVVFAPGLRAPCVEDATADTLDAVLCAVQAAWAWRRRHVNFGLPADMDPLEGWTAGAVPRAIEASTPIVPTAPIEAVAPTAPTAPTAPAAPAAPAAPTAPIMPVAPR